MKIPFFSKGRRVESPEGDASVASKASSGSLGSSSSSGSGPLSFSSGSRSGSGPLSFSSRSGSLRGEKEEERKKGGSLRKSGSFSLKRFTFGSQRPASTTTTSPPPQVHIPAAVVSRELSETFRYFDKNGDGKISASELGEVLRALGIHSTDEELVAMVREVDCDQDGFINVEEFVKLNKLVSEVTEGEDDETKFMQEAFHVFDLDGDGYISAGELYRVLSGLGEAGLTVEQCGTMIQNVDKDGNGLVDFSEFKCLMQDARVF